MRLYIKRLAARTPESLRRSAKRFLTPQAFTNWLYAEQSPAKKRARKKRVGKKHARTKYAPIQTAQKPAPTKPVQKARQPMPLAAPSPAKRLEKCIFAGFGKATAERFERYKVSRNPLLAADAAWGLALWYGSVGDYSKVLDHLTMRRLADPRSSAQLLHYILEIEALLKLGRVDDAETVLRSTGARRGSVPALCFLAANATALRTDLPQSEKDRLEIVSSGGNVLGVDHSETAVARARAHAPQARFECLSLDRMPYEAIFDAAVSMDVLFHVVDDTLWEASILRMIAAIKPGGLLLIQESFNMPGEAHFPHLRWRNLEDYRRVLAEAGARISTVEAYPIPHECTVKTVLTIECASEAPQLDMISNRSELASLPS